jgi:hypothetical protein
MEWVPTASRADLRPSGLSMNSTSVVNGLEMVNDRRQRKGEY